MVVRRYLTKLWSLTSLLTLTLALVEVMLTRKSMLQAQKMRAYLETYDELLETDINNFIKDREKSNEAHKLLITVTGTALNDEKLKG